MAKGYWIANVDVSNAEGYKEYVAAAAGDFQQIRRALHHARRQDPKSWKARAAPHRGNRISQLRGGARLLPLARIRKAIALRQAAAEADLIVIEGYDGPQP